MVIELETIYGYFCGQLIMAIQEPNPKTRMIIFDKLRNYIDMRLADYSNAYAKAYMEKDYDGANNVGTQQNQIAILGILLQKIRAPR